VSYRVLDRNRVPCFLDLAPGEALPPCSCHLKPGPAADPRGRACRPEWAQDDRGPASFVDGARRVRRADRVSWIGAAARQPPIQSRRRDSV